MGHLLMVLVHLRKATLFPLSADPHHDSPRKLKGVAKYLLSSGTLSLDSPSNRNDYFGSLVRNKAWMA